MTRPTLRYHGGKFRIASWVVSHFPPHLAYVEPFGGAASVLLAKPRSRIEVYNDLDDQIVGLFRVLRDPWMSGRLADALRLTPFARSEFYAAWEHSDDPVENARRLIVRSFQGVGANAVQNRTKSGWRLRTAAADRNAYASDFASWIDALPEFTERLRYVQIECRPWRRALDPHRFADTLVYADPPYPSATRRKDHRSVYRNELTDDDHAELLEYLREWPGMVVVSSYPNALYDAALGGWTVRDKQTRAQTNGVRTERLYINPAAVAAHQGVMAL